MDKGNKQPTFMKTVEHVSGKYFIPIAKVKKCVIELIDQGYLIQSTEKTKQRDIIRVIRPDWKKIKQDGIWMNS